MTGETLDWVVSTLAGTIGAHILAVFLFLAGVLLLTGASVAGVIKATSDSVTTTTRELRDAGGRQATRALARRTTWRRSSSPRGCASTRPEVFGDAPEFETPEARRAQAQAGGQEEAGQAPQRRQLLVRRGALPGPLRWRVPPIVRSRSPSPSRSRSSSEPEPVAELERLAEDPVEDEQGVTRGPAEPVDARAAHPAGPLPPRRHRLARTSSGSCRTRPSSRAPARRRSGRTPPGRRRSPRS